METLVKQPATDQTTIRPLEKRLALQLAPDRLNAFFPLLQRGVTVPAIMGCSLRSLLCDQFAIPSDYVTDRITTIFINNRPLDDLDTTIIEDGLRVTLSAAMPGLVGATMRRGGFYAALRQGISHVGSNRQTADEMGVVRLKLFNLLLPELGPLILARGLLLEQDELDELLMRLPELSLHNPNGTGRTHLSATFGE
ncbi:MAG: hypothetical protein GJV46_11460 [Geobacter sp.]|nr:hypothetical protein [Geobacter sp.]